MSYLSLRSFVAEETCEATLLAWEVNSERTWDPLELTEALELLSAWVYAPPPPPQADCALPSEAPVLAAPAVSINSTEMFLPSTNALFSKTAVEAAAALSN